MRRILLLAHRVPVSGAFTLNDLAGGAGRMDEVARVVSTAFTLSNDLRRDTELTILFEAEPPPAARRIRLSGANLRHLNPDERSTAALLKNALVRSIPLERDVEASPGLIVGPVDPVEALLEFAREPGAFWLTERGVPLRSLVGTGDGFSAILSDPTDPPPEELHRLESTGIPRVSLGPISLRSSQCVDVLHHEFDLRAASRAAARPRDPAAELVG
ncbi:MAG: tRNA (pseudouridine(54)-N(1))-methyltransferase TrmY [Thermoplasmata archaeon]|nr:tRNA (pseudouridine(54)-N(1))-methyltransferase TrmY [Thermoplasmata archaeon]